MVTNLIVFQVGKMHWLCGIKMGVCIKSYYKPDTEYFIIISQ